MSTDDQPTPIEFKIGAIVSLQSGGPKCTIAGSDVAKNGQLLWAVLFFDTAGSLHTALVPEAALRLHGSADVPPPGGSFAVGDRIALYGQVLCLQDHDGDYQIRVDHDRDGRYDLYASPNIMHKL